MKDEPNKGVKVGWSLGHWQVEECRLNAMLVYDERRGSCIWLMIERKLFALNTILDGLMFIFL